MKTYYELLQDPRWQKKRLEIMRAADFRCWNCGSDDQSLNVHHRYYEKGRNPWEYDDDALECLCSDCHVKTHALSDELRSVIGNLSDSQRTQLLGYAKAMLLHSCNPATHISIRDAEELMGVADYLSASPYDVEAVIDQITSTAHIDDLFSIRQNMTHRLRLLE